MRSALQKTALAVVVTSFALALSGCGDDTPSSNGGNARSEAANPNAGKPGFDAKGEPYGVFNPSPETLAKQKKEAKDALPWTAKFEPQPIADRSQYVNLGDHTVPFLMYHATRTWDETPEDIAASIGAVYQNYTSTPPGFTEVYKAYFNENNAFAKADALKAAGAWTDEYVTTADKRALVKQDLSVSHHGMQPYDMATQSFTFASSLFTVKTEMSDEESKQFRRSNYGQILPLRSRLYGPLSEYKFGFNNFESIVPLKITDEATARLLEGARPNLSIMVYGYVSDVKREHLGGVGKKERNVDMTPQFIDFVQDGKVIYTHTLN